MMRPKKILQLCFKKSFQYFFKFFYGNIKLSENLNAIKSLEKKRIVNIKSDIENVKDYYTYKIKNGRVYTDYIENVSVISENFLIGDVSYQQISGELKDPSNNVVLKKGTPAIKKKFKGKVLTIVQGASGNNYGHWLLEMLPKIKMCSENYPIKDINYLYAPKLADFQKESLSVLNISESMTINSEKYRHIEADELLAVVHPSYHKGYILEQFKFQPTWVIKWLRNTYLPYAKNFKAHKKVFLDRTDSLNTHCQFQNEKEISDYLIKEKGFVKYQLTKLSFFEKIFLFNNAEIIFGAHSSGFMNLVFCKPHTKVIEVKPVFHTNAVSKRISEINDLNYQLIETKAVEENKKNSGDIFLPLNELMKSLKNFI